MNPIDKRGTGLAAMAGYIEDGEAPGDVETTSENPCERVSWPTYYTNYTIH